ncbi:MAG TPA: metalloregulator ArsR/SmtB family transcription factor, partial [Halobacteriales archaeon]|nr:metalloregulator ArsR/SmtB family transcription factor [Halobacteriales archaeon]
MSRTESDGAYDALCRLCEEPDDRAAALRSLQPEADAVERQRAVFAALANVDRLRLLHALRDGEKCACELEIVLDAPQSTVATHLRKLRDAGLVKRRRAGKWSYYR